MITGGISEERFPCATSPDGAKAAPGWPGALILGCTGFASERHGIDRVPRWMADKRRALEAALSALYRDDALRERIAQGLARCIGRLGPTWRANATRVTQMVMALLAGQPVQGVVHRP